MIKNAATLRDVGTALYGPSWQTPLAEALGIADRTIRRMVAGDSSIADGVWADIGKLCHQRAGALEKWAAKLT
jgi:hypothetical protein